MKLTMKFILLLGVACLVVGVVGTAAALKDENWSTSGTTDINLEKKLSAAEVKRFSIESDITAITFLPSESDDILVTLKGAVAEQRAKDVSIDTSGSNAEEVNVVLRTDKKFHIGISVADIKGWMSDNRLRAEVRLPNKLFDEIHAESDVGTLELNDLKTKSLIASTNTGRIRLGRFEGESLRLQTDTGGIEVHDAQGEVQLQTDTGRIEASLRNLGSNVSATSDVGSIELHLLSKVESATFDLTSDVGGVHFSVPGAAVEERESHHLHATVGDGSASMIHVQTDTGRIEVTQGL